MAKKKVVYEEDDGGVVAPMNLEGMPWYQEHQPERPARTQETVSMTREEKRAFTGGVIKATLLVSSVFILAFLLFILFCDNIWFR